MLSAEELVAVILPRLERVQGTGDNITARCPFDDHEDTNASFSLNRKNGLWQCHGRCARKGNAFTLARELGLLPSSRPRAAERVPTIDWGLDEAMQRYGVEVTERAAVFTITDDEGNRCRDHARLHSGEPRFQYWGKGRTYHAYIPDWNLLREWGGGCGIAFIVEGDRDALTLAAHGWPSIGVLGVEHFERAAEDIAGALLGFGIGALVLTPDNDQAGLEAVAEWAPALEADGFVVGLRILPDIIAGKAVKDAYDAFSADPGEFQNLMHDLPVHWRA